MKKTTIKSISINELSDPLPIPVEIDEGNPSLGVENTLMSMRVEWQKDYDELQKYKTIEEEQSVDSVALFKAIKGIEHRSVYNIEEKRDVFVNTIIYHGNDLIIKGYSEHSTFLVKGYGKTWVLTKEELK